MNKADFLSNWQWFNNMITNVELSEEQLTAMFDNLQEEEVLTWIEEVRCCYVGTEEEEEAMAIETSADLARFYHNHPITM